MSPDTAKPALEGSPAEVDRIRDIIFGPQMRVYEQQFKRLVSQIDRLNKQLEEQRAAFEGQIAEEQARTRKLQES
jgi:hypothetical protein